MGYQLGNILCPFCAKSFQANIHKAHRKVRTCPHCSRRFFFYRHQYFVSLEDFSVLMNEKLRPFFSKRNVFKTRLATIKSKTIPKGEL